MRNFILILLYVFFFFTQRLSKTHIGFNLNLTIEEEYVFIVFTHMCIVFIQYLL